MQDAIGCHRTALAPFALRPTVSFTRGVGTREGFSAVWWRRAPAIAPPMAQSRVATEAADQQVATTDRGIRIAAWGERADARGRHAAISKGTRVGMVGAPTRMS